MLATQTLPLLDAKQRTLIAVNIIDRPAVTESTLIHRFQKNKYRVWRD